MNTNDLLLCRQAERLYSWEITDEFISQAETPEGKAELVNIRTSHYHHEEAKEDMI